MSKKTKYKNAPIDIAESIISAEIIDDFLPPPEQLVFNEETKRVTLNLSKSSVLFFKRKATKLGISYQRMMKRIIDIYARKYKAIAERN